RAQVESTQPVTPPVTPVTPPVTVTGACHVTAKTGTGTGTGTVNQKQDQEPSHAPLPPHTEPPSPATPTDAGRECLAMRQVGCTRVNPGHPDLLASLAEGVTPEALAATAVEAVEAGKSNPFAWAIATARSRHADGPAVIATGHSRAGPPPMSRTLQTLHALEAAKHAPG